MKLSKPAYLSLPAGELARRAAALEKLGAPCRWCPRKCGADRLAGETGDCLAGIGVQVASAQLHFGEEPWFTGSGGSGTVFFSCCSLGCKFCQNYDISREARGPALSTADLAAIFIQLQSRGAENINLVTPSHYPAGILAAIASAAGNGLHLPIVWNSSGYDSVEVLGYFDGVVDVYMPDFKFASDELAASLTKVSDYATAAKVALAEMVRQAGSRLEVETGRAIRGVSVRHLVLPGHYDDSRACLDFLHGLSPDITINLMRQYRPAYLAYRIPGMDKPVDFEKYKRVVGYGRSIGLTNIHDQA